MNCLPLLFDLLSEPEDCLEDAGDVLGRGLRLVRNPYLILVWLIWKFLLTATGIVADRDQFPLMPNILLIDDIEKNLNELQEALIKRLADDQLQVKVWLPEEREMAIAGGGAREIFRNQLDAETLFVVTDYDLTKTGVTGLFGSTIVNWCKSVAFIELAV